MTLAWRQSFSGTPEAMRASQATVAFSLSTSSVGDLTEVTNMPLALSKYASWQVAMPYPCFGDTLQLR